MFSQNAEKSECLKITCNTTCPLGNVKDRDGCNTCQCLKSGVYQGDILITGYIKNSFI